MDKKLLPGEVEGKQHRYKCYLCERETGIFEQDMYLCEWSVCHRCALELVYAACRVKEQGLK